MHGRWNINKGQDGDGLISSTGLVCYLDTEDRNAIRVNPKTVFTAEALSGIDMLVLDSLMF